MMLDDNMESPVNEDGGDAEQRIADLEARLRAEEALGVAMRRETDALMRAMSALTGEPEPGTVVDQTLLAISRALHAPLVALWRRNSDDDAVLYRCCERGQVAAAPPGEPAHCGPFAAIEDSLWRHVRRSRGPVAIEDCGLRSGACVRAVIGAPLMQGEELVGWVAAGYTEPRRFTCADRELVTALALPVALALHMNTLVEKSRTAAVLAERNRMAREIHDTLAQGFTGIVIQLDVAEMLLDQEPDAAGRHLAAARSLASASLAEARRSVWALRPSALEHAGLAAALENLARQMAAGSQTAVSFEVAGDPITAPPDIEANLLGIGLESVTNALKHAKATNIAIDLRYTCSGIRLCVRDDGRGFEVDGAGRFGGIGLTSMRERAQVIGGELSVRSRPGHGTQIIAAAPVLNRRRAGVPAG